MDWCRIITLVSSIALAVFTGGLVFATVCLWRSTKRYADATGNLVRVTERYTEATERMVRSADRSAKTSEKLLERERLAFLERTFDRFYPSVDYKRHKAEFEKSVSEEEVYHAYAVLAKKVIDDIIKELVSGDD